MLFNSKEFLLFFIIVVFAYFALPYRFRWILLLAASYYFYMSWEAYYAILILFTTFVVYVTAILMEGRGEGARRSLLVASLLVNLGLLFIFKYHNFIAGNLADLCAFMNIRSPVPSLDILLPVGISFYTFQALSYTVDVYRGDIRAERHFGIFALYISFFPQLVAGPIERSTNLLPQFYRSHDFNYDRAVAGLRLMAWGFFKKVVVADRLAILVNAVYGDPSAYPGSLLLLATVFFSFQIYCDFSGYSDIAIGAARVMGYDLMQNFRSPYSATSIAAFWRRWHISLSTWFRDYLYIPLGGSRVSERRRSANLLLTFVASGIWHGANWTFFAWGTFHGICMVLGTRTAGWRARIAALLRLARFPHLERFIRVGSTYALVCFGWILFRSTGIREALHIMRRLLACDLGTAQQFIDAQTGGALGYTSGMDLVVAGLSIMTLLAVESVRMRGTLSAVLHTGPMLIRWSLYVLLVVSIILFGEYSTGNSQFIYFQF